MSMRRRTIFPSFRQREVRREGRLAATIRARPVNSPATTRYGYPKQTLWGGVPCMMIKQSGPFIEPARVPRIGKREFLKIEMVTEFMAEGAQERAEGRNLLSHRRPHPYPDHHGFGRVIAKKFGGRTFAHSQRSGGKHANLAGRDLVELRCGIQKPFAGTVDIFAGPGFDRRTDGFRDQWQTLVRGQIESLDPVAFQKSGAVCPAWWNIGEHPSIFLAERNRCVYPVWFPWSAAPDPLAGRGLPLSTPQPPHSVRASEQPIRAGRGTALLFSMEGMGDVR
jgi:hypothetical protein